MLRKPGNLIRVSFEYITVTGIFSCEKVFAHQLIVSAVLSRPPLNRDYLMIDSNCWEFAMSQSQEYCTTDFPLKETENL